MHRRAETTRNATIQTASRISNPGAFVAIQRFPGDSGEYRSTRRDETNGAARFCPVNRVHEVDDRLGRRTPQESDLEARNGR